MGRTFRAARVNCLIDRTLEQRDHGAMSQLPLPKYHYVYLVLREQLDEGRFTEGLPGEYALMREFGVARVTVRRALEQLASEGLVTREPGRGTWPVASPRLGAAAPPSEPPAERARLPALLENLVTMGLRTSVKVIDVGTVTASSTVAAALRIAPGDPVHKAVRVRSTKAGPVSHIVTYVPAALVAPFGRRVLSKKPILVLLEEAGIKLGRAQQCVTARLANSTLAGHLDVNVGTALLAVQRLIYDDQDRPVQWLHGSYRPDRYSYEMHMSSVGSIDAQVWVSSDKSADLH